MEPILKRAPCGGLDGKIVRITPESPFGGVKEICERAKQGATMSVVPSPHPTTPGLLVLRPVEERPIQPEPRPQAAAAPDHQARLALIDRIDRLLAFEKQIAELEAENAVLQDLVARLASENRELRKAHDLTKPA